MPEHIHSAPDFNHFKDSAAYFQARPLLKRWKQTPEQFLVLVLETVGIVVPGMAAGAIYSTEHLIGEELWAAWKDAQHRCAGMCLRYLCDTGALPLEVVPLKRKYPLTFRMKTSR